MLEKKIDAVDTTTKIKFSDLGLSEKMLAKITAKGYEYPSAIQAGVIPLLLNGNKDIIGQAQTGTGKTAAFALPVLERIDTNSRDIQTLILAPTRELAIQVAEEIRSFADSAVKIQLLYGGQNIRDELSGLRAGPQIVVGTPGRVIDHLTKRKTLNIDKIKYFILDEADEMLNIGFKEEIEEIITFTPKDKKVLLFSATMPKSIKDIVNKYIKDHDLVTIERNELTNSNIEQKCYKVNERDKFEALCRVIEVEFDFYGILFCRTKADVDDVAARLMSRGYKVEGIHGDIDQKQREKTLSRFKNSAIKILVATDVAARGIDVNNLTHVVNYTLPDNPETYTHRIGRTGRAGNKGEAISFVSRKDSRMLSWIETAIKSKIKVEKLPEVSDVIEFKKKRLVDNTKELLLNVDELHYIDLAKDLLDLGNPPEQILAAILKESYGKEFSTTHYSELREESFSSDSRGDRGDRNDRAPRGDRSDRGFSGVEGQKRLFVAKGKLDGFSPGSLIQFIEKETSSKLGDVGNIDIMREFSFINLSNDDADFVLKKFKEFNPVKPLIVESKKEGSGSSSSSGSGFARKSSSRGSSYRGGSSSGGSRGGYRGNK
ncbi:MAG: DEAD/DEAH box helicase [Candidatus Gracilibacteria bacterium]|nr:DEAD/DEAH box helicase [Candidatus Gracilibacteria bacterium]